MDTTEPIQNTVVWPEEDYRQRKPEPGPAATLNVPPLETFCIQPGLDVYLASRADLPTVSMWMSFETGSVDDPAGMRGLASVSMSLLGEGTQALDKVAFATRQADLASGISSSAGAESSSLGLYSLRRSLEPTIDLFAEVLTQPGLRQEDLDRIVSRRLAALKQAKATPEALGGRLWRNVVMGEAHPYGRLATERSLQEIRLSDCTRVFAQLSPRRAKLFVAGAVSENELRAVLEPRLARWGSGDDHTPSPIVAPMPRDGTIFFVDVPGAAQAEVYVGHPGPGRDAPDYMSSRLMASILGGGFTGRVNMNLREDKGFSYGARANFGYYHKASWFVAKSSVRPDSTEAALRELHHEIAHMRGSAVSEEELAREQQAAILSLPTKFSTSRRMLGTYAGLVAFGLPLNDYDHFVQRVEQVTIDSVAAAAQARLQATDFKVLVVGDAKVVLPGLERLSAESLFGGGGMVRLDGDGMVQLGRQN